MNIAIIGGGASGMIAAYWLDRQGHAVTVYERQAMLGGHIRTLNQNVMPSIDAPQQCSEHLEMGVLEFPVEFKNFLGLMQELEVPLETVEVNSGLFFQDGRHFLSPSMIDKNFQGFKRWQELWQIDALYARSLRLWLKTHLASQTSLRGRSLSDFVTSESPQADWVKLLTMYSYSIAYDQIGNFPADLAIPALRRYVFSHWVRIKGGVYSYIEKIILHFGGELHLNTNIRAISRTNQLVQIQGQTAGEIPFDRQFDQVIFATPPDQVLKLLSDPRPEEVQNFKAWQPNDVTTILHCDRRLYQPYGIQHGSEFDFFQTPTGWGYNAALNQLCGLESPPMYSLAFNLRDAIDPAKIIHVQQHHTPFYNVESFRSRDQIIARNGTNNTYHVGAYLGDGLHEGAVTSALNVTQAIGLVSNQINSHHFRQPAMQH
jgi:uncharacterized protein